MRIILKILTFVWLVFWLFIGITMFLETPRQIDSDKDFIETEIKPSVDFVNNFKTNNGRLPNNREYYTWQREYYKDYSSDLTQQADSLIPGLGTKQYIRKLSNVNVDDYDKFKNADWNKDFGIGVWRGEWTEYYFSWTDSYETNNTSKSDSYIMLALTIVFGFLPFLFWWISFRRGKRST